MDPGYRPGDLWDNRHATLREKGHIKGGGTDQVAPDSRCRFHRDGPFRHRLCHHCLPVRPGTTPEENNRYHHQEHENDREYNPAVPHRDVPPQEIARFSPWLDKAPLRPGSSHSRLTILQTDTGKGCSGQSKPPGSGLLPTHTWRG